MNDDEPIFPGQRLISKDKELPAYEKASDGPGVESEVVIISNPQNEVLAVMPLESIIGDSQQPAYDFYAMVDDINTNIRNRGIPGEFIAKKISMKNSELDKLASVTVGVENTSVFTGGKGYGEYELEE